MSTEEQKANVSNEDSQKGNVLAEKTIEPTTEATIEPTNETTIEPTTEPTVESKDQKLNTVSNSQQQEVKQLPSDPIHITQDQLDSTPSPNQHPSSSILESTLDSLATISSKINPLTHRIGKQLGQVRQYAQEKLGTAGDITELPEEYKQLENVTT